METKENATFSGSVERVTYYNDESRYGVIKVRPDKKMREYSGRDGLVTVVGTMPEIGVGEQANFSGQWVEDPRYGTQMRLERFDPIVPTSLEGIKRYLASGIVKGIGERRAEYIVDYFGADTLTILNKEPQRLTEVPQIKTSLAESLAQAWEENVAIRQTMIFLQGHGVSPKMATRIHALYGAETVNKVQEDPYTLADEVYGIGFLRADAIARSMGLAFDAPERVRAGLDYALSRLAQDGHTFAPQDVLREKALDLLNIEDAAMVESVMKQRMFAGDLVDDTLLVDGERVDAVYLPTYHRAETRARQRLLELVNTPSPITETSAEIDWADHLATLSRRNSIALTPQQQSAVQAALTHKLSVLTGGPGTGKTTTLKMVINALKHDGYSFALASPTGRAAKRLSEATGEDAATIHRLFGFKPGEGFEYDEDSPLDVDMLIIDEASMVDLMLFSNVLRGLDPETHLMLVGDVDQLPSVGAGNVLRDVIDSGAAYVTRLETIFRQEKESHIIVNAHRINNGQNPYMENESQDFFYFGEDDPARAADLLVDVVVNRIPRKFGLDPMDDIQVIAPMYRGPAGVNNLNNALQHALNPARRRVAEKKIGERVFRVGDKVMQTRNNYEKGVFNGDIGRLYGIDTDDNVMQVDFDGDLLDYEYNEAADELIHAYCITIHRSQGSEYPAVVIPLLTQHYMMLQRNLLYTAITRARQLVVLVGSRRAVQMAVQNNKVAQRYSGLLARLKT